MGIACLLGLCSMARASKKGHLECLIRAHARLRSKKRSCVVELERHLQTASFHGHFGCMRYLLECGLSRNSIRMALRCASSRGNLACMQILQDNDVPWEDLVISDAAMSGQVRYLRVNGVPLTLSTNFQAAEMGQLDCIEYTHDNGNGVVMGRFAGLLAAANDHVACLQNLVAAVLLS